jgi:tetratricopeptide (TPR) repeat protein
MEMFAKKLRSLAAVLAFALLLAGGSVTAHAQVNATVKGKAVGPDGGPVVGAKVEMVNTENGRKFSMKTDKKGEYLNIGVAPGKYNVTLYSADGKVLDKAEGFPVDPGNPENTLDFNAKKQQEETQAIVSGQKQVDQTKLTEEQKKQIQAAQAQNEKVKQENAKIGNLNSMLAQARNDIQAKNYPNAIQTMQQALQADQTQPLIWGTLGDAQNGSKDYKGCVDSLKKAIDLQNQKKPNPQITSRWENTMGVCQARSGDVPGAQASFAKAAQEDPTFAAQAYFNEGAILTNAGKTDDANAAFDKSIQADPNKAEAYYQKGVNLMGKATTDKSGKVVPAPGTVDAFNKYLQLAPDGPNAATAQQILESMGEKVQTTFGKTRKK